MRRTELIVAGVAGMGLLVAIIADAAQQRFMRYVPEARDGIPAEISEFEAEQQWPGVNADVDDMPLLAYGGDGALSEEALARIAAIAPAAGEANIDPDVAQLTVRQLAHDALAVANDSRLNPEARQQKFRQLLVRDFDLRLMAKFALGRHWRRATAEQRQAYVAAFTEHLLTSYASRLDGADLASIKFLGSELAGKRDVMVASRVDRQVGEPIMVLWRLRPRDGQYRIIDVVVEGISMALTKRQEFTAIISAGGNDLDHLIARLAAKT